MGPEKIKTSQGYKETVFLSPGHGQRRQRIVYSSNERKACLKRSFSWNHQQLIVAAVGRSRGSLANTERMKAWTVGPHRFTGRGLQINNYQHLSKGKLTIDYSRANIMSYHAHTVGRSTQSSHRTNCQIHVNANFACYPIIMTS